MKRTFLFIFYFIATAQILIQIFNWQDCNWVVKPLIILSLMGFYFQNVNFKSWLFVFALFFCWLGDVLLMFTGQLFFMLGLGSFLVAHILLIVFYGKIKNREGEGLDGPQKARASFPVILIGTGLITVLYPTLGDLKIPVIIYAIALMIMVLRAINRYGFTSSKSFWYVSIGAFFFMISDSLLALNKFYFNNQVLHAGVWVMGTYIAAVYFITVGVIAHKSEL